MFEDLIASHFGMCLSVAFYAYYSTTDAGSLLTLLVFELYDFAALGVRTPPELGITENLFIAEEQLVFFESPLVDQLLKPLHLQ